MHKPVGPSFSITESSLNNQLIFKGLRYFVGVCTFPYSKQSPWLMFPLRAGPSGHMQVLWAVYKLQLVEGCVVGPAGGGRLQPIFTRDFCY